MNLISSLIASPTPTFFWQLIQNERLLDQVYSRVIKNGTLKIRDAFGKEHLYGNNSLPRVSVRLLEPNLHHKLALNPELFIGEAYVDGSLIIEEGSLKDFFKILFTNTNSKMTHNWLRFVEIGNYFLRHMQQVNTLVGASNNVKHHYDFSVDFYGLFLDSEKQYSCAYFAPEVKTLEDAQKRKMDHIISKLLIKPDQRILDIGCGWGGLACAIAKKNKVKVLGITLSIEQLNYAKKLSIKEGVNDRVDFKLLDYRSLVGGFDRIVSVGMFEHVGINHYSTFFQKIKELLKDDGVMLLHSIGRVQGPSFTNPWVRKYIFPGGYIPALSEVIPYVENSRLHITDIEILRIHYAKTLCEWRNRLRMNIKKIQKDYDDKFFRMWDFYLTGAEASFEHWGNMVFQLQLSKQLGSVPLTREYLYDQKNENIQNVN